MYSVYKHTFPNGKVYIGSTSQKPEYRWNYGKGYKYYHPKMFQDIVEYGWDNIKHEILATNLTKEAAHEMEYAQIFFHSAMHIELYNSFGAQCPAQKPTKHKPTRTVAPPQDSAQSHYKDYIIPLTPRPQKAGDIPVDVYDLNGNYIATFASGKIASQKLNVNLGDICSCCKGIKADGKRKYQAKGYIFRYAE